MPLKAKAVTTTSRNVAGQAASKRLVSHGAAKTVQTTRSFQLAKGGMGAEQVERIEALLNKLRDWRILNEQKFSDVVVVWPPNNAKAGGVEMQTLDAIGSKTAATALADLATAPTMFKRRGLKLNVLNHLDDALVVTANQSALLALRTRSPGLRMGPSAWAYLQYIRPLGDELGEAAIQVAPGAKVKRFEVRFADSSGAPVGGVRIKAIVNLDTGAHVAAVTDSEGVAAFAIPIIYAKVELILVEPNHTYWSLFVDGFDRASAPKRVELLATPLLPDSFALMRRYASNDPLAGQGVTVGVIDSGIGPHTALTVAGGRCLVTGENALEFEDNGIGHGTHVAGIIAAKADEGGNVFGIAPACRLMAYRVCPKAGNKERAKSADIAAALQQAIDDKCDIVNISMGSLEAMPEVPDMLEKARAAGIVVFAATGNDGRPELRYPARYSHTMAVGALGRDDTFPSNCPELFQESEIRRKKEFVAEFSNYGMSIDFIGPGVAVLSTFPGEKYAMMSGTSMASPFIAGMAARILSRTPDLLAMPRTAQRVDALIQALTETSRKIGWPEEYEGFGVLMEKQRDKRGVDVQG